MKANKVKTILIYYMLWQWGYLGAVTEYINYSDVFGVKRTLYTAEFEIKTERGDLLKEINIIKKILKEKGSIGWDNHKKKKHNKYLGYWPKDKKWIPNEFSFVCPDNILDSNIGGLLDVTPYGLYIFNSYNIESGFHQSIRPKKIHQDKISKENLVYFFRKLSTENQGLREKIFK